MSKEKTSIGDRMKRYEACYNAKLTPRMPIIVRVDGRAFHTFTKHMKRPFDDTFIKAMNASMIETAHTMQGFKIAYCQSDEASFLLTDYDDIETQGWFDYEVNKIVSISSATMSVNFNSLLQIPHGQLQVFDSRVFNVPKEDISNYFLWRQKDWARNSIQMYCRSIFSHKQMHLKKQKDMHEMLYSKGKNWAKDLSDGLKNGYFYTKQEGLIENVLPNFKSIDDLVVRTLDGGQHGN